jgi:RNA polymerase sigma-70 factor (ECF subfamily)
LALIHPIRREPIRRRQRRQGVRSIRKDTTGRRVLRAHDGTAMRNSGAMSPTALEDAELLEAVNTGDEAALETLYRRYGGSCFGLARRILDDKGLAEDVVQQVFTALWKGSGYDVRRGAVSTWLMSVTHHKSIDVLRREAPRRKRLASEQALLELAVTGPGPDEEAWMHLRAERTRAALQVLPAEQRELLLLAYYGGYSQSEIAGMTGLPLGTVKSRTLTAMRKMRVELGTDVDVDGKVR